ncbi:MAG TPA: ATP-dependent DNA ligase [Patescibacteria group bacterium]|nr:ATP-dependent DNA ligase [Patescibacteria group bacterium]
MEPAAGFPELELAVRPPYPPMEALAVDALPPGDDWLFEPKWDGFRCLAFRAGDRVVLQSKSAQPLTRYFPELVAALLAVPLPRFVLDGEIVVAHDGRLDFDALLQRIHPAESRVRKLSRETPVTYLVFDVLVDDADRDLTALPLAERRRRLERLFAGVPADGTLRLSPVTGERELAGRWLAELGGGGLDGVVAKRADAAYASGERTAMRKVKHMRTADCVVGGFRYAQTGGAIGSLLLGLYDDEGLLHHVGFSASFTGEERRALKPVLEPLVEPPGFTVGAPGGPSRWSAGRNTEWKPLAPRLVCEVRYDHFSGGRFRHGTKFLRWRPDKAPRLCTLAQLEGGRDDSLAAFWGRRAG